MGTLLSSSRRSRIDRRRSRYTPVRATKGFDATGIHPQSTGLAGRTPPSQIDKDSWTCESDTYKYPINGTLNDPWERCYNVVNDSDQVLCAELKSEISDLLVVAGLFLGIVTAFTIESFSWLREDHEQASAQLLAQVVQLLNDSAVRGSATHLPDSKPHNFEVVVNQVWFLSMTLSLSAVIVGTLCLQWLSAFRNTDVGHKPYDDALALRELRFQGLVDWGVPYVPAILLLTVQGALVLFAIGLLYLLWNVDTRVALPVAIVSGVSVALLTLSTVMPLLQSALGWLFPSTLALSQCPYKSPISWVTHRGCVLLAILCSLSFSWLPPFRKKMSAWRSQQLTILTDFLWRKHDEFWRQQREAWGPQSSKMHSKKYSYYLVHGLASAMNTLVFQPSAVHIIHDCLQEFQGSTAEVEMFKELFGKNYTNAEEELLVWSNSVPTDSSELRGFSPAFVQSLRRDFLNAQALQHFVAHNQKLHRILLPHRVELYIRIKNSSCNRLNVSNTGLELHNADLMRTPTDRERQEQDSFIGVSIECPILTPRDAHSLTPDLRRQFLKSAAHLIDTPLFQEPDALGTALVLRATLEDELFAPGTRSDGVDSHEAQELDIQETSRPLSEDAPTTAQPFSQMPSDNPASADPHAHDIQADTETGFRHKRQSSGPLYRSVREKLDMHYRETSLSVFGSDAESGSESSDSSSDAEKPVQRGEDMA